MLECMARWEKHFKLSSLGFVASAMFLCGFNALTVTGLGDAENTEWWIPHSAHG